MKTYRIAVIPGDGIGKEVMPEGVRALDAASRRFGFTLRLEHLDWNCDRLARTGQWMPENWKDVVGDHDAIYFGATGWRRSRWRRDPPPRPSSSRASTGRSWPGGRSSSRGARVSG